MFKLIIILLFIIKTINSLNPTLDLTDRDLHIKNKIPCVQHICKKYLSSKFKLRGSLVIVNFPLNNIAYTNMLLKTFNEGHPESTLMPKNADRRHIDPKHVTEKAKHYFMIVNHSSEIIGIIKQLRSLPTWNSLAEVLVWLLPIHHDEQLKPKEIVLCFELLLNASFINVHLMHSIENSDQINVLTWHPYGYGNCANTIGPITKVADCKFVQNKLVVQEHANASMNIKIPATLNNCTFKVSATNWIPFSAFSSSGKPYGIEVQLINLIANKIALHPEYIDRKTNRANSAAWNSTYADLLEKKVHVMIGGLDENPTTRKLLSSSISYFEDDITWCVHVAQPKPTFENVFVIFEHSTWLLTFVIVIFVGVLLFYLHNHDVIRKPHRDISWALLLSYAVTLSCPGNYFPKATYLRLFFIAFVLYGFHINIAYHSKLISFLTKPRYETQVNSLEVAIDKRFVLTGGIANFDYFTSNSDVAKYVTNNLEPCTNIDACFEKIKYKHNYAVAISRAHALNLNLTDKKYYCFPRVNNVYPFSISMLFQQQYHLITRFNEIIRRCKEAGLVNRWAYQYTYRNKQQHATRSHEAEEYIELTLKHVQGAFILWSVGIGISILVFIIERYHPNRNQIRKLINFVLHKK